MFWIAIAITAALVWVLAIIFVMGLGVAAARGDGRFRAATRQPPRKLTVATGRARATAPGA